MPLKPLGCFCAGFAGLSLIYGLTLNVVLVCFIQFVCQLANSIVSVERVQQYMKIESEGPAIVEGRRPSPNWPVKGKVQLQNLQVINTPKYPIQSIIKLIPVLQSEFLV